MASGFTNRGKYLVLGYWVRNQTVPTNYYVLLATDAATPTVDTNLVSDLTEVSTGQGYTAGGYQLTPGSTDFDTWTEDDTNDRALIQCKDIVWTASGGTLPASDSARWAVLTDDDATPADRQIYVYWDLVSNRQVSDTQALTLQDCEARLTE